ncbi:MAG: transposase [Kofleriaceae bacterium]
MASPRQIFPNQFYLLTRNCTQRQFLLRPDPITNNIFIYCLAEAAQRFGIMILGTVTEGNHHHTVLFDPEGRVSEFMEHLHKMSSRCLNERWGRSENLWANEEPCLTRLLDRAAVIQELIYTAGNPVKDGLVERAIDWPGVNGYAALLGDRELHAQRPEFYFSAKGVMPAEITLRFEFPQFLGSPEQIVAEVRDGVTKLEQETKELRNGRPVLGSEAVLSQSPFSSPKTERPRTDLRPRFAGGPNVRIPALLEYKNFLVEYRRARRDYLAGLPAIFPPGTNRLRRLAPIVVAPLIPD